MIQPDGSIKVGGHDVREYDLAALRRCGRHHSSEEYIVFRHCERKSSLGESGCF